MPWRTPLVLLSTLAVVILWACTSSNRGTLPNADFFVSQGQRFPLRVGDTAGVQTSTAIVLVRFSAVVDDNRCPENVECAQAGHATILLSVQTALAVNEVEVQVPPGQNVDVEVVVEEVTLTVHEVAPPAQEGVEIDMLEYAVLLSVRQTGDIGL